jgi:hypothetical protein
MTGKSIFKITGLVLLGIVAAVALGFLLGLAVMYLWNWLMPELFGLPEIDYWQAVGIFILCHLLFKSHTSQHSRGDKDSGKGKNCNGFFKARIDGKLRDKKDEEGLEGAGETA